MAPSRSSRPEVFCIKVILRNLTEFAGKHLRPEACNFIKKETLAQVLSCEFCEISKNTFYRAPPVPSFITYDNTALTRRKGH